MAERNGWLRYSAGAALLTVIVVASYRLAIAPIHAVGSAAECEEKYADARSHADSVSADFLSFRDSSGHKRRCGELHPSTASIGERR